MQTHLGHCPSCGEHHDRVTAVPGATPGTFDAQCPTTGAALVLVPGEPAKLATALPLMEEPPLLGGSIGIAAPGTESVNITSIWPLPSEYDADE